MAGSELQSGKATRVAILGAGTWGATLARLFSSAGRDVSMWSRNEEKVSRLNQLRQLSEPLPVEFPENLNITSDLEHCLHQRDVIIFCCTSQSLREVASAAGDILKSSVPPGAEAPRLVSAVKGLELSTLLRMSQILNELLPELPACSLSGPNLAGEILHSLPTASVIACSRLEVARWVQNSLSLPILRLYVNQDITGVELGGALKNVIAIAAGAVDGLRLGTNAKAALITRGLAEMTRLAVKLGAERATLSGLAGLGDLLATCSSSLSRNYRLGYKIACGQAPADALSELGAVAEGVSTASAVVKLSDQYDVEMPIARQVEQTLKGECRPDTAIMNLMSRPLASE